MASWQAGMVNAHAQTFHGFPTAAPPTRLHNMQAAAPPPPPPMGLGGNNDKDMTMSWPTLGGAPQNAAAARMSMKESSLSSAMNVSTRRELPLPNLLLLSFPFPRNKQKKKKQASNILNHNNISFSFSFPYY